MGGRQHTPKAALVVIPESSGKRTIAKLYKSDQNNPTDHWLSTNENPQAALLYLIKFIREMEDDG